MRHVTYVVDKDITDRDEAAAAATAVLNGVGSPLTARLDCSADSHGGDRLAAAQTQ
jgi:hypothetical protein